MNRRKFIYTTSLSSLGVLLNQSLMGKSIYEETGKMPALFMGHGSPMNAIEDNQYTRTWEKLAQDIPTPKAILIVSAHWETQRKTQIYAGTKPKMIYDMYGFPKNLYEVQYPASGNPALANDISKEVTNFDIAPTHEWGLDHGAWSVLVKMFPKADIPCFQLSLNTTRDLQYHYDLAKELKFLRSQGVLILGSGNIVHNLRYIRSFWDAAPEWALSFDQQVADFINNRDHEQLIKYQKLGKAAEISVNSAEHYIPLLYILALQEKDDPITYSNESLNGTLLDVSMRCVRVG